jgi:hypothetical protein
MSPALYGQWVKIHYNLNRCRVEQPPRRGEACWTVHHKGKVVGYASDATLVDVHFSVQPGGAQHIRDRKRRSVVAWATGILVQAEPRHYAGQCVLTWNPYKDSNHFVVIIGHDRVPVASAALVRFGGRAAHAVGYIRA